MHESESEVAQSCPTLCDPMDCRPPGSSIYGIFQARVLEWGAIAFSDIYIEREIHIYRRQIHYCLSYQRSTGRQNNIFENCSYSSRLYGYTLYYWMKENLKKLKVDCKYEFLYNKLPLPTDFYYKMKDAFLWIMKVDVGDTM